MPAKIPGVGQSPVFKRPTPDSFGNPQTKKAKNEEGQDEKAMPIETLLIEGEPANAGNMYTTGELRKAVGEDKSKDPKDSEMTAEYVKPKKFPSGYLMNVNGTLIEAHHGTPLREIVNLPITVLRGINEDQAEVLSREFKVKTIRDLANWKFYQIAKSIEALAEVEEKAGRLETSLQNINDAVDKTFEKSSLKTIMEQKAEVMQGVGPYLQRLLSKKLGIITMKDFSNFKPSKYAAALVALADYETAGFESKTTSDDSKALSTFRPVVA